MAARLTREQDERSRSAIQTTQLVKRLQCYALQIEDDAGNVVELDSGRLKAIEVLLRKTLPDLAAVTVKGDADNPLYVTSPREKLKALLDRSAQPG